MTKASLDPEFVLITTDALNSFTKHLTSTGRPELARTLVQQAADLELLSPELQIWSVRARALVEAQAVATAEIAQLDAELGRTQGDQAKLSNNLYSLSEEVRTLSRAVDSLRLDSRLIALEELSAELKNSLLGFSQNYSNLVSEYAETVSKLDVLTNTFRRSNFRIQYVFNRSILEKLFFRVDGRPVRGLRRLLFHKSGKPRKLFRILVLKKNGKSRRAFSYWMTTREEHDNVAAWSPPADPSKVELRQRRQDFDALSDEEFEREFALCVELMYRNYLGRSADADGLRVHIGSLRNGMTLSALARTIENSPEAVDHRQRRQDLDAPSDGEFVVALAEFLFQGRGALPEEVEHWKNILADDRARRIELIKGAAETFLANKRGAAHMQNDPARCLIMGTDRWIVSGDWENKARELRLSGSAVPHSGTKTKRQLFGHSGEYVVSAIASLYKGGRHIEQFLENITTQTIFDRSELIIIDADSPEGEYQTIAKYQENFPNILYKRINYRLGIYDAWNVGVEMSRGRYLTNTNLDDLRRRDSFELQAATLDRYDFIDVVYQDFFYNFDDSLSFEEIEKFGFKSDLPIITPHNLLKFNSPHNGPMWRRSLHAELGLFDTSYKSAGDWEFWLRCLSHGKNFLKINKPHIAYLQNPNGISTRPDTPGLEEGRRILRSYSDKLISSELRLSREGLAEALATQADWDVTTAHYDVVQRELNRLGARFRGKIETTDSA